MVDQLQEWQSDPAGKHRFRLHADGRPTDWVSDGTTVVHDPLPPAQAYPGVAAPSPQPAPAQPFTPGGLGEPVPTSEPARPAGWYRSAANPSEVRYWDGSEWTTAAAGPADGAPTTNSPPTTNGRVDPGGAEPHVDPGDGQRHLGASVRATTPAAPADWYPDPSDRTRLRYWDGLGWTERVIDEGPSLRS